MSGCLACVWAGRRGWPKTLKFADDMAVHVLERHGDRAEDALART